MPLPLAAVVLGPSARQETRALVSAAALSTVAVAVELARPWPLAIAVDHAIADDPVLGLPRTAVLAAAATLMVGIAVVAGVADMLAVSTSERAAERVGSHLRQRVFDAAMGLSLRWHDRTRSGELTSRITTDVGRLLDAVVAVCATLLPDVVRLVAVLVVLTFIDPVLAVVAVLVVPVLALFAVRQRRAVRAVQTQARAESGRFVAAVSDLIRNVRVVQAFGRYDRSSAAFGTRNTDLLAVNQHAARIDARWTPAADVVLAVGSGVLLVVGGRLAMTGRLSVGDLLVVMTYLTALYSPVRSLSRLSVLLAKSAASATRIAEVLACDERIVDRPHALPAPAVTLGVQFHRVGFGYGERRVLGDLYLDVPAGSITVLTGPSGAGKSTVLNLLLRLYDVDDGAITVDGVDLRDVRVQTWRRQIAFVPQDPWLVDGTVRDNIVFGATDVTWAQVQDAARTALVDEFVADLDGGYDAAVGEGGAQLSGGQRRRLALARAAVCDAPLLVLDEPTASLDATAAATIVDAIRRAARGRTVLVVTHDDRVTAIADHVVRLDRRSVTTDRSLVESGRR